MDDTGKSKSSVDNKNTVTCITDSDNKITTDDAELDNKAITGAKKSNNKTITDVTNMDNNKILINTVDVSKKSDEEYAKDKELVINEVLDEFLA